MTLNLGPFQSSHDPVRPTGTGASPVVPALVLLDRGRGAGLHVPEKLVPFSM